jgi:hypothetical protein
VPLGQTPSCRLDRPVACSPTSRNARQGRHTARSLKPLPLGGGVFTSICEYTPTANCQDNWPKLLSVVLAETTSPCFSVPQHHAASGNRLVIALDREEPVDGLLVSEGADEHAVTRSS